jgi:hyaluronan synthase
MVEIGTYGISVGAILLAKLALSLLPRRQPPHAYRRTSPAVSVAAVVTVYNEGPETLYRCLASIYDSTRRPDVLTVVDDGSTDQRAVDVADLWAPRFADAGMDYKVIQHAGNWGKREALATGFDETPTIDVYVCVDSDTILQADAIEHAVRYFAAPDVHCVAGVVLARNRDRNLLTRLIDMRYVNAFLYERAAYSRLGAVLCASGALAAYRGWVVRKYLDGLLAQRWLGRPAVSGDDRRLTYYCLLEGKAVLEPQAVAFTDVPERLGHFLRQQARWTRSFLRETLCAVGSLRPWRTYWWLSLIELIIWLAFTAALIVAMGSALLYGDHWLTLFLLYLLYALAASYVRSLHYLRTTHNLDRALTFVAAPLYTALNIALLIPLRLWCLVTLRGGSWGTRRRVEVADSVRHACSSRHVIHA